MADGCRTVIVDFRAEIVGFRMGESEKTDKPKNPTDGERMADGWPTDGERMANGWRTEAF